MDLLPPEIKDEIACNLVYFKAPQTYRSFCPRDNWNLWTNGLYTPVRAETWSGSPVVTRFAVLKPDMESLVALRQVSRSWCASATRAMACHCDWKLDLTKDKLERVLGFAREITAGTSMLGSISNLHISGLWYLRTFLREHNYDFDLAVGSPDASWQSQLEAFPIVSQTLRRTFGPGPYDYEQGEQGEPPSDLKEHYDKTEEHSMMRSLFAKLGHITTFTVKFPRVESFFANGEDHEVECYDELGLNETLDTIYYGLQSPAFQSLASLALWVPTTHDAARLGAALDNNARQRLRSLQIVIVDETGPSGCLQYSCEEGNHDGEISSLDASGYLPSNWHVKHPNQTHQDEMFDFVTSCHNLESLSIEATQYLDLDRFDPSSFKALEVLSLKRFWAKMPSVLRLVTPLTRRLILFDLKIRVGGGQWSELFASLTENCPDLDYFHMDQCSYFLAHPSHEHNNRPYENSNTLWTIDQHDLAQLEKLIARMVELAGGRRFYPGQHDYYDEVDSAEQ